jgi:tripartite-type tricarboxylate transporter receptor subunit TctC
MKKGIMFLLGVFLAVSLMANGKGESGSSSVADFKYPTKTVEILVGSAPGGDNDLFPRVYAKYLEKLWGVPVIISNLANHVAAADKLYDAPSDGYTLQSVQDAMLINMVLGSLDFGLDDLTIVGMHSLIDGQVIALRSALGFNTLADFAKACEAKPDSYTLAVSNSSTTLVMGEMMKAAGLKVRIVDSSNGNDRVQKMLGGHIDSALLSWAMTRDYVATGQWKALCILNPERSKICPEVPTAIEQGYNASYPTQHVFYMPKGVDPRIVEVWNQALVTVSKDPALAEELFDVVGGYPYYVNAADTKKILQNEVFPLLKKYLGN